MGDSCEPTSSRAGARRAAALAAFGLLATLAGTVFAAGASAAAQPASGPVAKWTYCWASVMPGKTSEFGLGQINAMGAQGWHAVGAGLGMDSKSKYWVLMERPDTSAYSALGGCGS